MLKRLINEETGMTMGLTVVMIVLIGVMGAGLLTFVQRDLEAVIEVNRGQGAAEVSDVGVQAAKRQLLANSFPSSYDSTTGDNSDWAYNSSSVTCGSLSSGSGKCITTSDGEVRVTVRYLPPPTTLSGTGTGSRRDPNYAPVNPPAVGADYTDKRDYFRIESDGVFNGARRKIQAILVTEDIGLPKAYFATDNINMGSSSTTVSNVSLFAKDNVTGIRNGMLIGTDSAYGNWLVTPYNDKARLGNTTLAANATGAAAEGSVTYDPTSYNNTQKNTPAQGTDRYKRLDFDASANLSGSTAPTDPTPNYRFCSRGNASCGWPSTSPSQPPDIITYPFDPNAKLDPSFLQSLAEQQIRPGTGPATSRDNYVEQAASAGTIDIDQDSFYQITPALSSVFVVRFTGLSRGNVDIEPTGSSSPCPIKGTILVINGSINTSSSGARCFDGVVSIQDPNNLGTLTYNNVGNFTLNGFVNIQGTMTIQGSVDPILGNDVLNQPGYHDVKVWGWRECYNATCS